MSAASVSAAQAPAKLSRFDSLDLQAQFIMEYLRCSASTYNAVEARVIAPLDSGTYTLCADIGHRMTAAFVKFDSTGKRPKRLTILDPRRMVERREPVDTAEILVLLRAQRYADWLAWKDSVHGPRGLPVVYRADTLIHVWMFPVAGDTVTNMIVGGERHYVFPRDAKQELSSDPVPPSRIVKRVNGAHLIQSLGDSIPTFSEILAAHMIAEDRQEVTIELPRHFLKLLTGPGMGAWIWIPKKP